MERKNLKTSARCEIVISGEVGRTFDFIKVEVMKRGVWELEKWQVGIPNPYILKPVAV